MPWQQLSKGQQVHAVVECSAVGVSQGLPYARMPSEPQDSVELAKEVLLKVRVVILDDFQPQRVPALKQVDYRHYEPSTFQLLVKIAPDVTAAAYEQNFLGRTIYAGDAIAQSDCLFFYMQVMVKLFMGRSAQWSLDAPTSAINSAKTKVNR